MRWVLAFQRQRPLGYPLGEGLAFQAFHDQEVGAVLLTGRGTRRLSSSNQFWTKINCGGPASSLVYTVSAFRNTNRCPSGEMSYFRPHVGNT